MADPSGETAMYSTRDVLDALRRANPASPITEDRVRHALRRGDLDWPSTCGGRLIWSSTDIQNLAAALDLRGPILEERS